MKVVWWYVPIYPAGSPFITAALLSFLLLSARLLCFCFWERIRAATATTATMSSSDAIPVGDADIDIEASQRGRIIGSCVAILVITDVFVLLRLVSRKLARAGYWVCSMTPWG